MSPLKVGEKIPSLVIEEVDPERMKVMALLLRDPNPIHWDTAVTARLGLGDCPINQGPINMSYLLELALRAAGEARVRRFGVRFLGSVLAGARVECRGVVTEVDEAEGTARIQLEAISDGQPAVSGYAEVTW